MQGRNVNMADEKQQFASAINKINEAAYIFLQKKQYDVAIIKLKQGQQLLQYAAESCRNIKRELIIVILHNIVSLSQAKWDLITASNYLEGLIYNFELTGSKANSTITLQDTPTSISLLDEDLMAQIQLAQYYLQYCAINSQLRKHKNAQSSARKGLRIIVNLLKQSQWIRRAKNSEVHEFEIKRNILKYLLEHWQCSSTDKDHALNFILPCQFLWKGEVGGTKKSIQNELRTFSIGNIMTLQFKHIKLQKNAQFCKKPYFNFVLMSMALFSLATEVRFESEEKLSEARHYHSLAIIFYFIYVPYESPYIQHIKDNYLKNYGSFQHLESPTPTLTYSELLSKIKRDSILESSMNLQQESITSIEQQKRRNERLKQQNLKLKMLCLAQVKPKRHPKSYQKAKSLTISHSNAKKISIDSKRNGDKTDRRANKTNANCIIKTDHYYTTPDHKKRRQEKQILGNHNKDDMAEKYFEMAFKKDKLRSPQQRKDSIRSTSSTTKDKSGNQSKNAMRKSKEKISSIKSRKAIKK